ncbi:hypothetical protein BDP27DRAFT_1330275 [Rhodocollybia butyracea]|uniref:Uncharacterized protein n=1 Tax=Rhodocollybia butyracea TaxID=206335 RepID=A0A9P5U4D0_9AGAR|nr:hypothetical protein BDP27DRAFT_1330275 [Rhodocollybia butyracea]
MVFTARLVNLRRSLRGEIAPAHSLPLPSQFCVKLAKPEYIRSLAREAWFYEQLSKKEGYPGAVTPVCFGFFTCPLASESDVQIPAWSSVRIQPEAPSYTRAGEEPVYDFYIDDRDVKYLHSYFDDDRTSHLKSRWHLKQWRERADRSPVVGTLITERIGEPLRPKDFPNATSTIRKGVNHFSKEAETEIMVLLDDLNAAGILHGDVRFNNILRDLSSGSELNHWFSAASQICPRHNQIHLYRIIDFDRACRWNTDNPVDQWRFARIQSTTLEEPPFWGDCTQ